MATRRSLCRPSRPFPRAGVCGSLLAALLTAVLAVGAQPAWAGGTDERQPVVDKSDYSLANPVPAAMLRELNTDRPDATESPFTVDPGHLQLEMDFVNYSRDRFQGTRTSAVDVAAFNLRLGVLHNFEAGLFWTPYVRQTETPSGGMRRSVTGVSDLTVRGKINIWGNDGGDTALGLIVDVTAPTATREVGGEHFEGAIGLPVAFELAGGWSGGAMTVMQLRHREAASGYQAVWLNTVTVDHGITANTGGYLELTSAAGDGPHVATFNVGLTWKLDRNTQFDAGANIGISRRADDLQVFTGLSRRF